MRVARRNAYHAQRERSALVTSNFPMVEASFAQILSCSSLNVNELDTDDESDVGVNVPLLW